jgi:predicted amidohydrolase YtcJ
MKKRLGIFVTAFVLMCLLQSPVAAVSNRVTADTIFTNGKIVTVDKNFTIAKAVAIKDGKFIAIGQVGDVIKFSGPKTMKIDLRGKTVIPGLIDSHNHMSMTASQIAFVQLKDVRTVAELVVLIKAKAATVKPGEWIQTAMGWHESQLAEQRLPTRWEIDAVAPNNPVYIPRGGHVAVANTCALNLARITKDTPDPSGGSYVRDAKGELTGVMYDNAKDPIAALLPKQTYAQKLQGLKDTVKMYNSYGITGAIDPLVILGSDELKAYFQLWGERGLTVRTGLLIKPRSLSDVTNNPYWQGFGDNILRIAGLKLLIDGGVESALMSQPYMIVPGEQENPNYFGVQVMPTADHLAMLQEAAKMGWHFETHAVGDKGIDIVADNYAKVIQATPSIKDKRWTIMHCEYPTQTVLDKMKANGIWVTVQDNPTYLGRNKVRYWGMDRAAQAMPTRALLDRGFVVGGGTDGPIVPIDPFLSLWWFVTRNTVTAGLLGPEQRITREEALRAYTIWSAHFTFEETIKGSIEPGKLADLVVLDRDILTCPEGDIKDVRPLKTMVGGKFVYEAKPPQGRYSSR